MVAVLNDFAFCLSGDIKFGLHKVMIRQQTYHSSYKKNNVCLNKTFI